MAIFLSAKEGPTRGKLPKQFKVEFRPLWQMDQKELVETRKLQAETDQIYMETGVLDPEEVTASRCG